MNATNLYGFSMCQHLPYDEFEMWHGHPDLYMKKSEKVLNTPDHSDVGHFVEVDLRYPDNKKEKTKNFPFCTENKVIFKDKNIDYMNKKKPKIVAKAKKLKYDCSDKKNYVVHYRMLKFYVIHGMVVEKIHEIISSKQDKWLEKF